MTLQFLNTMITQTSIRRFVLLVLLVAGAAAPLPAQDHPADTKPIGRFTADVRGAFPKFKQDPTIATAAGVDKENLPGRALGLVIGAHWYPARIGRVTFGLGGEIMMARASHTIEAATEDATAGPTVRSRFSTLAPQVSFNSGKREGWSYISGGIGGSRFTVDRDDAPLTAQEGRSKTINYGGGARWFSKKHVAFSVDLRFYAVNLQVATALRPAIPRMTFSAFSVGIAVK